MDAGDEASDALAVCFDDMRLQVHDLGIVLILIDLRLELIPLLGLRFERVADIGKADAAGGDRRHQALDRVVGFLQLAPKAALDPRAVLQPLLALAVIFPHQERKSFWAKQLILQSAKYASLQLACATRPALPQVPFCFRLEHPRRSLLMTV